MKRSTLYGIAINDTDYVINGSSGTCVFYRRWAGMLTRCYSKAYMASRVNYEACTVCDEWLLFSNFKKWMKNQDWQDKQLDKDILVKGNNIYSPETCIFITQQINTLLNSQKSKRGKYPQGVSFRKDLGSFEAYCSFNGKKVSLGQYQSTGEASEVYKAYKYKLIAEVATTQDEPLKSALLNFKL